VGAFDLSHTAQASAANADSSGTRSELQGCSRHFSEHSDQTLNEPRRGNSADTIADSDTQLAQNHREQPIERCNEGEPNGNEKKLACFDT
jgi:hypothetical protein